MVVYLWAIWFRSGYHPNPLFEYFVSLATFLLRYNVRKNSAAFLLSFPNTQKRTQCARVPVETLGEIRTELSKHYITREMSLILNETKYSNSSPKRGLFDINPYWINIERVPT